MKKSIRIQGSLWAAMPTTRLATALAILTALSVPHASAQADEVSFFGTKGALRIEAFGTSRGVFLPPSDESSGDRSSWSFRYLYQVSERIALGISYAEYTFPAEQVDALALAARLKISPDSKLYFPVELGKDRRYTHNSSTTPGIDAVGIGYGVGLEFSLFRARHWRLCSELAGHLRAHGRQLFLFNIVRFGVTTSWGGSKG